MELNTETVTTPPRPASTLVLLRDAASGLEVLLLKRHALSDVLGGAYVFPGGKVDARDASHGLLCHLDRSPGALHAELHEADIDGTTAASLYVAAIREAFEESGILLAEGARHAQAVAARAFAARGSGIRTGADPVVPAPADCADHALVTMDHAQGPHRDEQAGSTPDSSSPGYPVTRWPSTTTMKPPKASGSPPRAALERYWQRDIDLAPPQIMSLSMLTHFRDVAAVLRHARSVRPPVVAPEPFLQDGVRAVCYPGDERHSVARRAFPGPTRLAYRDGRFEPAAGFESLFACSPGFFATD